MYALIKSLTRSLYVPTYALALGTTILHHELTVSNLCCGISYGGTQFRVPKCSQNTVEGILKVCFECETISFDLQYLLLKVFYYCLPPPTPQTRCLPLQTQGVRVRITRMVIIFNTYETHENIYLVKHHKHPTTKNLRKTY